MKKSNDVVWGCNPDSGTRNDINVNFEVVSVRIPRMDSKFVLILILDHTGHVYIGSGNYIFKSVPENFSNSSNAKLKFISVCSFSVSFFK